MSTQTNPLLTRLQIPGETFRLPSQGLFYTNGELREDVVDGEIHVFPMTAYDEIVFKTPDMLLSGKAIDEVFGRCIPQVLKPRELLAKDIDFLVTCLRVITYGPDITLIYNHGCSEAAKDREYTISLQNILRQAKAIDPTTVSSNFSVQLQNGQVAQLKPTTYDTILGLNQSLGQAEGDSLIELQDKMMSLLVNMIVKVDEVDDPEMISEWVKALPAGWVRFLNESIDKVSDWGVQFTAPVKCKDCGEHVDVPFSANPVSFFS